MQREAGICEGEMVVLRITGLLITVIDAADDGRPTFHPGDPVREGEPRIAWRRIGTHEMFGHP